MKLKLTKLNAALCLLLAQSTVFAGSGNLFNVSSSGTPIGTSITVCLNASSQLSCQTYTVSGLNISILTTIPNRTYTTLGFKVNTKGYTTGTGCTLLSNGFCTFTASDTSAANVTIAAVTKPILCDPTSKTSATLQACVDQAAPGDTLQLGSGEWLLTSPVRLTKSIIITAANTSNRPILKGAGPLAPGSNPLNRAFQVTQLDYDFSGITIQGLDFHDFSRAILIAPQDATDPDACVNGPAGTGMLSNVVISDNHFVNSRLNITLDGGNMDGITLSNNVIDGATRYGMRITGGFASSCDNGSGDEPTGFNLPTNVVISNNIFNNTAGNFSIDIWNAPGILVQNNHILNSTAVGGIANAVDTNNGISPFNLGSLIGNEVRGPLLPLSAWNYLSSLTQVSSEIKDNLTRGRAPSYYTDIYLANYANNMIVKNNDMDHEHPQVFGANIILDPDTYGNVVTVTSSDVVDDQSGGNNTIIVE